MRFIIRNETKKKWAKKWFIEKENEIRSHLDFYTGFDVKCLCIALLNDFFVCSIRFVVVLSNKSVFFNSTTRKSTLLDCVLIYKCTFPNFHCYYCYYDGLALIHLAITINKGIMEQKQYKYFVCFIANFMVSPFSSCTPHLHVHAAHFHSIHIPYTAMYKYITTIIISLIEQNREIHYQCWRMNLVFLPASPLAISKIVILHSVTVSHSHSPFSYSSLKSR